MKYTPFGETRYTWGGTPTDRRYTGQREESGLGSLYDYNARMYSPVLGRFLSADTIVPKPNNPQQFNRYAYVLNNPLRYVDPSGHFTEDQLKQWTMLGSMTDKQRAKWIADHQDLYNMLLQMHFGDRLYFNHGSGDLEPMGRASFNQTNGHLQFDWASSLEDLAAKYNDMANYERSKGEQPGLVLGRRVGDDRQMSVVYWSGAWSMYRQRTSSPFGARAQWVRPYAETDSTQTGLQTFLEDHLASVPIGAGVSLVCGLGAPACAGIGAIVTLVVDGVQVAAQTPGRVPDDRTLTYQYADGAVETTIIRGNQIMGPHWK
jgi:RHS repeat-associated protein